MAKIRSHMSRHTKTIIQITDNVMIQLEVNKNQSSSQKIHPPNAIVNHLAARIINDDQKNQSKTRVSDWDTRGPRVKSIDSARVVFMALVL